MSSIQSETQQHGQQGTRRAKLLINPQAWHGESDGNVIEHICDRLAALGIDAEAVILSPDEPGGDVAKAATQDGFPLIIAAGGDGTIHEIARGLLDTKATLGIIPFGTMNNIAASLNIPTDLDAACEIIAHGKRQNMDVGMINGQPFLEAVSVGFEVPLFSLGEQTRHQGMGGMLRAGVGVLGALIAARPHGITIEMDGQRKLVRAQQITICNTPRYGLGFAPAPDALVDDGRLDIVIERHARRWDIVRHYWSIMNGKRELDTRIQIRRAKRIRLTSKYVMPVAADGESVGSLPANIIVAPRRLHVMAGTRAVSAQTATSPIADILRSMAPHHEQHSPNVFPLADHVERSRKLVTVYWIGAAIVAALAWLAYQLGLWKRLPIPKQRRTTPGQGERHTIALTIIPIGLAAIFWRLRMGIEAVAFLAAGAVGAVVTPLWRQVRRRYPQVVEPDDATMHAVASVGVLAAGLYASRRATWRRNLLMGALAVVGTWLSFLDRTAKEKPERQRESIALGAGLGVLWLGGTLTVIAWAREGLLHVTNSAESAPSPATRKASPLPQPGPNLHLSAPVATQMELERGDILLFGPDGTPGAQMIEFLTRSYYHHSAIYDGEGMLLEAMPEGVMRAPLGQRRITAVRMNIPAEQRHAAADWARGHVGDHYDTRGLALIAFDRIFPGLRLGGPPANRFSCAVFVADAYLQVGYDLLPNQRWEDLVPGDFVALIDSPPKAIPVKVTEQEAGR